MSPRKPSTPDPVEVQQKLQEYREVAALIQAARDAQPRAEELIVWLLTHGVSRKTIIETGPYSPAQITTYQTKHGLRRRDRKTEKK